MQEGIKGLRRPKEEDLHPNRFENNEDITVFEELVQYADFHIQQWASPLFKYVGHQWSRGAKASIFLILIMGPLISFHISIIVEIFSISKKN